MLHTFPQVSTLLLMQVSLFDRSGLGFDRSGLSFDRSGLGFG